MKMKEDRFPQLQTAFDPSYEDFVAKYAAPGTPVLLRGVAVSWAAMSLWSEDFFASQYSDDLVKVENQKSEIRFMTVGAYVEYMRSQSDEHPYYLHNWHIERLHPELMQHYSPPAYFKNWLDEVPLHRRPSWRNMFIGPSNTGTGLHQDVMSSHSWLFLARGRKRWVLFPPDSDGLDELLSSGYRSSAECGHTGVDLFDMDSVKDATLKKLQPLYCMQEPGDIVFIPSNWYHEATNLETSIGLSENYVDSSNARLFKEFMLKKGFERSLKRLEKWVPGIAGY